jgi:PAS domain S-box-containing protein
LAEAPTAERLLLAAFAALPDAVCILQPVTSGQGRTVWRYAFNNQAMQQMFGVGDLSGQTLHDRFPATADEWARNLQQVLESNTPKELQSYRGPYPGYYDVMLSPIGEGDERGVLAIIRDVTNAHEESERQRTAGLSYESLIAAIDQGFCVIEIEHDEQGKPADYVFLEANDAHMKQSGLPNPVGKRVRELLPDMEEDWIAIYGEVARTGEPIRFELGSGPLDRWFDVYAFPVGQPELNRVGILFEDASGRKQMERELKESELRFRSLVAASSDMVFRVSADWSELLELEGKGLIAPGNDPVNWLEHHVVPDDRPAAELAIKESTQQDTAVELELRARKADGSTGWFFVRAVPVRDDAGLVTEWFGMATETTSRRAVAQEAAQGAEMLRVATEVGRVGLWDWDALADKLIWSDALYHMIGVEVGSVEPTNQLWNESVHPDDLETILAAATKARDEREDYVAEMRVCRPNGDIRWLSARGRYLYDQQGNAIRMVGAMIDMTERRQQEEWQKLLVAELQHRVRNLLSMVRSVVRQSVSSHHNVNDYVDHLIGRLQAMARTQGILTRSPGGKVDLEMLVREELVACAASEGLYEISGPDVKLSPQAAEVLTLAIHELATNSVKYGAIGGEGQIKIDWKKIEKNATMWLLLNWYESVDSSVPVAKKSGFGTQLIEGRIPYELNGAGRMKIGEDGVRVELEFPLSEGASVLEAGIDQIGESGVAFQLRSIGSK